MAGIATHLLEFPPEGQPSPGAYDTKIRAFIDTLKQVDPAKVLKADAQQDFFQVLDPRINSISYLYILRLRLQAFFQSKNQTPNEAQTLLLQALSFMQQFDTVQIRYVGSWIRDLIELAVNIATHLQLACDVFLNPVEYKLTIMQQLQQAVNPIVSAIFRIDQTSGTLTSTHIKLLKICLQLRMYREALPVLACTIHSFPAPKALEIEGKYLCSPHLDSSAYITQNSGFSEKLDATDVHEFFLLGGMIYIGLQKWEDAKLYLECVLISPSQGTPTSLQVEAYKKWMLTCCMIKGVMPDPPKAANQNMLRAIKSVSKPYDTVAEVFQSSHMARLRAEIGAAQGVWYEDGNTGLVQLLLTRISRFEILSMQDTYSAVPLATVSEWLKFNINELHAFIEEMVNEGALNADIDLSGNEPVLRFYSNQSKGPLARTEKEYHAELIAQTKRTNDMAEFVKMSDRRLTLTKEYIEALRKREKGRGENGMGAAGEPLDDPASLEEDIMMDD